MSPRKTLPHAAASRLLWPSKVVLPTCPAFPSNKARLASSSPLATPSVRSSPTVSRGRPRDHYSSGSSGRWWSPSSQPMSTGVRVGHGGGGHTEGIKPRTRVLHAGQSSAFLTPMSIFEQRAWQEEPRLTWRHRSCRRSQLYSAGRASCCGLHEFLHREGRETSFRKSQSPNAETTRGWPGSRVCLTSEAWDLLLLGKDLGER